MSMKKLKAFQIAKVQFIDNFYAKLYSEMLNNCRVTARKKNVPSFETKFKLLLRKHSSVK